MVTDSNDRYPFLLPCRWTTHCKVCIVSEICILFMLVFYQPLATLQAHVHKYTWRPCVMKSSALEQNLYDVKGLVEYSAQSNLHL